MFPAKDVPFGGPDNIRPHSGVKPPKKPKIGPNRHFTAKSTKRQNDHISVSDEDISDNFERQIVIGSTTQKCKIRSKGVIKGSRDPILELLDPLRILGTVEAIETRNLACRWTPRGTNQKNEK